MAKTKAKYLLIKGDVPEGALTEDDITLVEFTEEEVYEYPEKSFNRDTPPDLLISVEEVLNVINNSKPVTFKELFND